ncbi:phosphatidylglycerophosphatase and protein-tyrosine phosphatase 1 isoform X2 [Suricata suricatta]|uniref:phosphatidylglycerophosphatase and protein-tyrosine phosphatase 1 isoform X2 n=1 Tax=Suricata suricatta TaxID=37032 RepID=UPI0011562261|nr:phosphatidylglycerophosphatase and protein-tyrosine phosphatase 1 isoform X2 [Suricata suricatta]
MAQGPGAPGSPAGHPEARPEVSASRAPTPTASPSQEAADDAPPSSSSPWGLSSRPPTASPAVDRSPSCQAVRGGMAAGTLLEAGLARVLFYPTLLYTVFRGKVPGRAHRDWYHRIDPTVLLGALPLRSMTRRLVQDENVRGVITMNEEYETRFLCNSSKEPLFIALTPDFSCSFLLLADLVPGVEECGSGAAATQHNRHDWSPNLGEPPERSPVCSQVPVAGPVCLRAL